MAATNKSLAENNKSRSAGEATKDRSSPAFIPARTCAVRCASLHSTWGKRVSGIRTRLP
jgi:hypothetical protein